MELGDKKLVVHLALEGSRHNLHGPARMQIDGVNPLSGSGEASEVLCLLNMVTADDLRDVEDYTGAINYKPINHFATLIRYFLQKSLRTYDTRRRNTAQ